MSIQSTIYQEILSSKKKVEIDTLALGPNAPEIIIELAERLFITQLMGVLPPTKNQIYTFTDVNKELLANYPHNVFKTFDHYFGEYATLLIPVVGAED